MLSKGGALYVLVPPAYSHADDPWPHQRRCPIAAPRRAIDGIRRRATQSEIPLITERRRACGGHSEGRVGPGRNSRTLWLRHDGQSRPRIAGLGDGELRRGGGLKACYRKE